MLTMFRKIDDKFKLPDYLLPQKAQQHARLGKQIANITLISKKVVESLRTYLNIYIDSKAQSNMSKTQLENFSNFYHAMAAAFNSMQLSLENNDFAVKTAIYESTAELPNQPHFEKSPALDKLKLFVQLFNLYFLLDTTKKSQDKPAINQAITALSKQLLADTKEKNITRGLVREAFLILFETQILKEIYLAFKQLTRQIQAEIMANYTAPFMYQLPKIDNMKNLNAGETYFYQQAKPLLANTKSVMDAFAKTLGGDFASLRKAFRACTYAESTFDKKTVEKNCFTAINKLIATNDALNKKFIEFDNNYLLGFGNSYKEFKSIHRERVLSLCALSAKVPSYDILYTSICNMVFLEKNLFANLVLAKVDAFLKGLIKPLEDRPYYKALFSQNAEIGKVKIKMEGIFITINQILLKYKDKGSLTEEDARDFFTELKASFTFFQKQVQLLQYLLKDCILNQWNKFNQLKNTTAINSPQAKLTQLSLIDNVNLDSLVKASADLRSHIGKRDALPTSYEREFNLAFAAASLKLVTINTVITESFPECYLQELQSDYTSIAKLIEDPSDETDSSNSEDPKSCYSSSPEEDPMSDEKHKFILQLQNTTLEVDIFGEHRSLTL